MGENLHVTDGRMSGGKVGSIISGIIIALFFNIIAVSGNGTGFRVFYAILSIGTIPIAIIGQKIFQKVYDLIHGKNDTSVYVATSLKDIIMHKFFGALMSSTLYEGVILFLVYIIIGNFAE